MPMRCPVCGDTTRVKDSRDDRNRRNEWLMRQGDEVFGFWTRDFRVRRRKCVAATCRAETLTIEVILDDLSNALNDVEENPRKRKKIERE